MADMPAVPLVKKVSITPIQQRIAAVNDDKTLAFALHGDLNRVIGALANVTNYNADTTQLIIDTLNNYGILVGKVNALTREQALVSSYTDPTYVLSTTSDDSTATVVIMDHKRVYGDSAKTTVNVTGKTIAGLALGTAYYFYYDDPTRAGGAVDIKYSTNNLDAAQTGNRHSLGAIQTPAANQTTPETGGGVNPPGGYRFRQDNTNIQ